MKLTLTDSGLYVGDWISDGGITVHIGIDPDEGTVYYNDRVVGTMVDDNDNGTPADDDIEDIYLEDDYLQRSILDDLSAQYDTHIEDYSVRKINEDDEVVATYRGFRTRHGDYATIPFDEDDTSYLIDDLEHRYNNYITYDIVRD